MLIIPQYPQSMSSKHVTEISWIKCYYDYEIDNSDTIEELHKKIKYIV
jgi:hypothetical protein